MPNCLYDLPCWDGWVGKVCCFNIWLAQFLLALGMRLTGPMFIVGFYYLLYLHVDTYIFDGVMAVVKKRLGVEFGLVWTAVGVIIGYNVLFNHTMAAYIKAGGPEDLVRIEKIREKIK